MFIYQKRPRNPEVNTSENAIHFETKFIKQCERRTIGQKRISSQSTRGILPILLHSVERWGSKEVHTPVGTPTQEGSSFVFPRHHREPELPPPWILTQDLLFLFLLSSVSTFFSSSFLLSSLPRSFSSHHTFLGSCVKLQKGSRHEGGVALCHVSYLN